MNKEFFAIIQTWYGGYYAEIFDNQEQLDYALERAKDSFANTQDYDDREKYIQDLMEVEDDPYHRR